MALCGRFSHLGQKAPILIARLNNIARFSSPSSHPTTSILWLQVSGMALHRLLQPHSLKRRLTWRCRQMTHHAFQRF